MTSNLWFWITFVLALLTGHAVMLSAVSSDNPNPDVVITWPCDISIENNTIVFDEVSNDWCVWNITKGNTGT